jgi:hypothetical protein
LGDFLFVPRKLVIKTASILIFYSEGMKALETRFSGVTVLHSLEVLGWLMRLVLPYSLGWLAGWPTFVSDEGDALT